MGSAVAGVVGDRGGDVFLVCFSILCLDGHHRGAAGDSFIGKALLQPLAGCLPGVVGMRHWLDCLADFRHEGRRIP